MHTVHRLISRGLETGAGRDQSQPNYSLMRDLLEFTEFLEAELPPLLARWRERRAAESRTSTAGHGDRSHLTTGGTT